MRALLVVLVLAVVGPACAAEPGETHDAATYLGELHDLRNLPRFERRTSELAAGWDRHGGNDYDGLWHLLDIDGEQLVLLDVEGPGIISRISTGSLAHLEGARLQVRLDHQAEPLIDMPAVDFFDPARSPFGALVHAGWYPTLRMPIPFAEHAELRLVAEHAMPMWGLFWQIGHGRLPADTEVETLSLPLDTEIQTELDRVERVWSDALCGPPEPSAGPVFQRSEALSPGEAITWSGSGPGTIERLEFRVAPNAAEAWKGLHLRMTWDQAERAAVDMPLADFVGAGHGDASASFDSLVLGGREGWIYLRLPMPHDDGALIEVRNQGESTTTVELGIWRELGRPPADFGRLHAHVHAEQAASEKSPRSGPMQVPVHRLLDAEGRGKLVGVILQVDWPHEDLWWGEGDWQIWADQDLDEWPPRYHGTGTEEFFDGGWTHFEARPLAGAITVDPGLVTIFGFMVTDAIVWQERIRVQVETVGLAEANAVVLETHPQWRSTVFWYAYPPN